MISKNFYFFIAYPTTCSATCGIFLKGAYTYDSTAPYSYYSCLQNDLDTQTYGYICEYGLSLIIFQHNEHFGFIFFLIVYVFSNSV